MNAENTETSSSWYVAHRPNNDDIIITQIVFGEPVDYEQAMADAEYTFGGDYGSVLKISDSYFTMDTLTAEEFDYDA